MLYGKVRDGDIKPLQFLMGLLSFIHYRLALRRVLRFPVLWRSGLLNLLLRTLGL